MNIVKIIAVVWGIIFLLFGYFIYFKKKYDLINDFKEDFEAKRKNEQYAKRVGLIEFIVGAVLLVVGIILIIFA